LPTIREQDVQPASEGCQRFQSRHPYVVYFRKLHGEVRIARVLHSARRRPELREDGPGYKAELAQVR
jgi:plasmid stabilization system protein ParE